MTHAATGAALDISLPLATGSTVVASNVFAGKSVGKVSRVHGIKIYQPDRSGKHKIRDLVILIASFFLAITMPAGALAHYLHSVHRFQRKLTPHRRLR